MSQQKEIRTMYWITHPAFALPWPGKQGVDKEVMQRFFKEVLVPFIKRVQSEPDSVVVLIKSPVTTLAAREMSLPAVKSGLAVVGKIESDFELFARRMLKKRIVVATDSKMSTVRMSEYVDTMLKKKGFIVASGTRFIGTGSYYSACAKDYPLEFAERYHPVGKKVVKDATSRYDRIIQRGADSHSIEALLGFKKARMRSLLKVPESMCIDVPNKTKRVGFASRKI